MHFLSCTAHSTKFPKIACENRIIFYADANWSVPSPTIPEGIKEIPFFRSFLDKSGPLDPNIELVRDTINDAYYALLDQQDIVWETKKRNPSKLAIADSLPARYGVSRGGCLRQIDDPSQIQRAIQELLGDKFPPSIVSDFLYKKISYIGEEPGQSPLFIVEYDPKESPDTITLSRVEHLGTLHVRQFSHLACMPGSTLSRRSPSDGDHIIWRPSVKTRSTAGLAPVLVPHEARHHYVAIPNLSQYSLVDICEELEQLNRRAA